MNLGVKSGRAKTFHTNFTVISVKKRNVKFHTRTLCTQTPLTSGSEPVGLALGGAGGGGVILDALPITLI